LPASSLFELPGPAFLNFLGAVVIGVLLASYLAIYLADRSGRLSPAPVPTEPAAMATAFLSGGVGRVIQMLVYDLDERGYLVLGEEGHINPTGKKPTDGELDEMELRLLAAVRHGPTARQLFEDKSLRRHLYIDLAPVRAQLATDNLLQPDTVRQAKRWAQIVGTSVILAVAALKLRVVLAEGANPSYLIYLTVAAIGALLALGYVLTRETASKRGLALIEALKQAYAERLKETLAHIRSPGPQARAFGGASLFLIGLYGFSPLKGTTESKFVEAFQDASGNCDE
jgi:uncharacterized protein (TIGR04222 family)